MMLHLALQLKLLDTEFMNSNLYLYINVSSIAP